MSVYCARCGEIVDSSCSKSYYEYHENEISYIQPDGSNYKGYCSCGAKLETLDDIN